MPGIIGEKGWGLLCPKTRPERALKIERYAAEYLEPMLVHFPELHGRVYLALRKFGWLAEYNPVLHIVIREEALESYSEWRMRATTAHELVHLVQFINGEALGKGVSIEVERQATFLTFSRGFAFDFLKAFSASCTHDACNRDFKLCYYNCGLLFSRCCRDYTESELRSKARQLETLSQSYGVHDHPDYFRLVGQAMATETENTSQRTAREATCQVH